MLTRLKQICNHPCLVEDCDDPMLYGSGKWEQWEEIIEECLDNRYKVVVFSQYTSMLDLMQNFLNSRDVSFCSIRGDMSLMKRQDAIRQFDEDQSCRVCLASLLAGGVGIDLTAAQVVVHYDRWWNPAKEEQATARVHRMGQQQVVQVIKLITCNTLEEKLHLLLQKKQALAADVIVEDDASILKSISREDLISLFTVNE
jgi:SNF2 family DNA or RNA helicase